MRPDTGEDTGSGDLGLQQAIGMERADRLHLRVVGDVVAPVYAVLDVDVTDRDHIPTCRRAADSAVRLDVPGGGDRSHSELREAVVLNCRSSEGPVAESVVVTQLMLKTEAPQAKAVADSAI